MIIEFKQREKEENKKAAEEKRLNVTTPIGRETKLLGQYKKAVGDGLTSIMKEGGDIDKFKNISKAYKSLKQYDKAIKNLNRAKEFCHFDPEIYYELGLNYLLNAECEKARKNFIRTIKLDNKNLNAQIQLALSHESLEEDSMAEKIYKKIIEENPRFIEAYNHLAGLYIRLEMYEQALVVFYDILKVNPNYYRANLGIGVCFDKLKRYSYAIRFYKKYICKKPKSSTARALANRILEIYQTKNISKDDGHLSIV